MHPPGFTRNDLHDRTLRRLALSRVQRKYQSPMTLRCLQHFARTIGAENSRDRACGFADPQRGCGPNRNGRSALPLRQFAAADLRLCALWRMERRIEKDMRECGTRIPELLHVTRHKADPISHAIADGVL